ncbi:hypothetical protein [Singulisphaera sp. PoT]|uniref:hypothetical protein n=1 Tax=Singulisphaera sp. PoT TaxID=3411797 RepID=UPI003BF556FB
MRFIPSIILIAYITCSAARAEHAKINLEVKTPRDQKTAYMDQTPPAHGKNPRPVIKARANETINIQWMLTNIYPHKTLENVVVHFFIAKQEKLGQKDLPDLSGDVELESAFDMDFKPGSKAGQRLKTKIATPGIYLIRLETSQTQSDHEHFAAIDLVVE